jgi:uncharacterized MAPEG superfamily protein
VITLPLACIPIVLLTVYAPRVAVAAAQFRQPGGMDNKHPRDQQATLTGWARRANASHANGFEAFAPFAAAVLTAHAAQADAHWTTILAVTFVVARTLYPVLYVANVDKLRSTVWMVGFMSTLGIFGLALAS